MSKTLNCCNSLKYLRENEIESPWILSLNFQVQSSEYDVIWVMVDRLTKLAHFLAIQEDFKIRCRKYSEAMGFEFTVLAILKRMDKVNSLGESSFLGLELVSPWKGVMHFGKKGKLAPRYVWTFEILERIGLIAYRLRLPKELSSVHDTFHVSNLKKCLADANLHMRLKEIKVDKTLCFIKELVEIMDREIKKLKRRKIALVKVRWNSKRGPEFTWEHEDHMRIKYPQSCS
ncbi:hypothetical protein Tco_1377438 [Tanacetum coccineum]